MLSHSPVTRVDPEAVEGGPGAPSGQRGPHLRGLQVPYVLHLDDLLRVAPVHGGGGRPGGGQEVQAKVRGVRAGGGQNLLVTAVLEEFLMTIGYAL